MIRLEEFMVVAGAIVLLLVAYEREKRGKINVLSFVFALLAGVCLILGTLLLVAQIMG